jgi:hypothetical protein
MKKTLKKGIMFLVLALLAAGGVFAQKVGDTVQVGGKDYRLEEVRGDGRLLLQPVATLDGVWVSGSATITISGSTGIFTTLFSTPANWQDAADKGYVKAGDQAVRNLKKAGDLTWTAEGLQVTYNTSTPNVATGTRWVSTTITISADGKTFQGMGTWTRR